MDPESVKTAAEKVANWDPAVIALGKLIIGLGLVGLALWLSPYTLTDLFMTFGIPLLIIAMILAGTGITGSAFLEMINSKRIGEEVQGYLKEYQMQQQ